MPDLIAWIGYEPMKNSTLVASVLLIGLLTSPVCAQAKLVGAWAGKWVRDGAALDVVMTFVRAGDGYTGSFDSEQLRVIGIPIKKLSYIPPNVRWTVVGDATTTIFEGELRDSVLRGQFREGKAEGSFALTRMEDAIKRPREEPISFRNGDVALAGSVVLPDGTGPFAGVVFLHGSGAEGRHASRFLAVQFARRGVAALIYDKRGVGESKGDWRTAGFEELVHDSVAAVNALRSRADIACKQVGIHGHSQGGTIAPWVATRVKDLAFVVASAASGIPAEECEIFSVENSLGVGTLSAADAELAREYVRALVSTAYRGTPRGDLETAWKKVKGKSWVFPPPAEKASYWALSRRIADFDPLVHWRQVAAPTLLVYGESDERVPVRRSAARIAGAYLTSTGAQLDVKFFEGADHTFRLSSKKDGSFDWPKSVPGYPDAMLDWVSRQTNTVENRPLPKKPYTGP
ncbi:MAG: alpha/beta fold hydrolase [Planctomycetes bacterium]|nr:alpha/beta fold hydrolase [Planctomycetota bacterium]